MIVFIALSIILAILDWIAVAMENRRLEYVAKPATMVFLILWFGLEILSAPAARSAFFLMGLIFSLGGDIFLMLPKDRFLAGLVAFLLGHIAYIISFNIQGVILQVDSLLIAVPFCLILVVVLYHIQRGLSRINRTALFGPVSLYGFVLSLMAWSAITTTLRSDWLPLASVLVACGGTLFMLSDTILAWGRFVHVLPGQRLWVIITYHLAQLGMAVGFHMTLT